MNKPATKKAKRTLLIDCYDLLIANLNCASKFYESDCDELWAHLLTRTDEKLRETMQRQTAINNVSEAEMRHNCQFEGLF